jgi:hypothetical protein
MVVKKKLEKIKQPLRSQHRQNKLRLWSDCALFLYYKVRLVIWMAYINLFLV